MKTYRITPHDLLFFRDGRPLDRNKQDADHRNIGHGAFWPRPDHLYNAVMHALLGTRSAGRRVHFGKFNDLKVIGPYPLRQNQDKTETLFLPRPLDWRCELETIPVDSTDAPKFIQAGFIDKKEGKKDYPAWISDEEYKQYLAGKEPETPTRAELFKMEPRIGNTLDPNTGASKRYADKSRSGQYEAQYLRLEKNVTMWAAVDPGKTGASIPSVFIMGGQNAQVDFHADSGLNTLEDRFPCPTTPDGSGPFFIRWTLLAPALFVRTGWLPGWCLDTNKDEAARKKDGIVMFPDCPGVSLVAACTGKPLVFSGYDSVDGIKDTQLAVPAGSCYVFRCETREGAEALVTRLHLQRKSDFGSQGFGIGVCSYINPPREPLSFSSSH